MTRLSLRRLRLQKPYRQSSSGNCTISYSPAPVLPPRPHPALPRPSFTGTHAASCYISAFPVKWKRENTDLCFHGKSFNSPNQNLCLKKYICTLCKCVCEIFNFSCSISAPHLFKSIFSKEWCFRRWCNSVCQVTQFDIICLSFVFFQYHIAWIYREKVGTWYQFDVRVFPHLQGTFKYNSMRRCPQAKLQPCVKMLLTVVLASALLCSVAGQGCLTLGGIKDIRYLIDNLQVSCGGGCQWERQLLKI